MLITKTLTNMACVQCGIPDGYYGGDIQRLESINGKTEMFCYDDLCHYKRQQYLKLKIHILSLQDRIDKLESVVNDLARINN